MYTAVCMNLLDVDYFAILVAALSSFMLGGIFWISSSLGLSYIFEQRPLKLFLINGSYCILQFSLMGLILGIWP